MPIISDLTGVKCYQRISVQCDTPGCGNVWETDFHGKRTLERKTFFCKSCLRRVQKRKINLSWRRNTKIITPPYLRRIGDPFEYRCEKCKKIFSANYAGSATEAKDYFLCLPCSRDAHIIAEYNPAILTPPNDRIARKPVMVQCQDCKGIYEYRSYDRKLESRKPWRCLHCTTIHSGKKKRGMKMPESHRQKLREYHTGKKRSEETKRRIGAKHKGKHISEEHKALLRSQRKGKKLTEAHRQKIIKSRPQASEKRIKTVKRQWLVKGVMGFTSKPQNILFEVVKELYTDAEINDTTVLKRKIIDITIPSLKVAIEYDGWAHFKYKHQQKDIQQIKDMLNIGWRILRFRVKGKHDIYEKDVFKKAVTAFIKSKKQYEWLEFDDTITLKHVTIDQPALF